MGYHEKRGKFYRARWRDPAGKLQSMSGFPTAKAADKYWQKQEALVDEGRYVDPKAGQILLSEWIDLWRETLDLELSTMENYRYLLGFAAGSFGDRAIASIAPEEVVAWEKTIASEYSARTARDARSTLATCLGDAVPHRIPRNPAARGRARGKKATRRIERKKAELKAWATPLEAFLVAERAAALSGQDGDFVKVISLAYTGARWSEISGLCPEHIHGETWDLHQKLYELNGHFYRGWPKDGSMRTIDVPPFLQQLVNTHLSAARAETCTCRNAEEPYCPGEAYVFLGPDGGHARRSDYARRVFRPAADGAHPSQSRKRPRPPVLPVFADATESYPGVPLVAAVREGVFWPSGRRRQVVLPVNTRSPRAALVEYAITSGMGREEAQRHTREELLDLLVRVHQPGEDAPVVAWRPVMARLTPHGLRHSHETWMAEEKIADVLRDERMGHGGEDDDPDLRRRPMRDSYTKISEVMRGELVDALQKRWEQSLADRVEMERHWPREAGPPRSTVAIVNELLAPYRDKVVAAMGPVRKRRPLQAVRPRRLVAGAGRQV